MVVEVVPEGVGISYDKPYSYSGFAHQNIQPGMRVRIPFGKGNRERTGFVISVSRENPPDKCKPVLEVLDEQPLLDEEQIALGRWLRDYTFCTYYEAFRVMLPPGLSVKLSYFYCLSGESRGGSIQGITFAQNRIIEFLRQKKRPAGEKDVLAAAQAEPAQAKAELLALCESGIVEKISKASRKVGDEKITIIRLSEQVETLSDIKTPITVTQKRVVELLLDIRQGNLKEVCYFAGVSRSVADKLRAAGIVEYYLQEVYRSPYKTTNYAEKREGFTLSIQQQMAYDGLEKLWKQDKPHTALLYGVTGSGKTQVYIKLMETVLNAGQGAIMLVPEIALTPQTVHRFQSYFGETIAVLHSGLSMGERLDEWKRVRRGEAMLVVGTRSAVFAPVKHLGLMILDEEQESSYQSERSPKYHARNVAAKRMQQRKGLLLLASATPSVETYHYARKGAFAFFRLDTRYGEARLPDVSIVDLSTQPPEGLDAGISADLRTALAGVLERKEQAVLLLNRRGYHTTVKCAVCGEVAQCPNCSVALTYHTVNGSMMCHYCGYIQPGSAACTHCGNGFKQYGGIGIQKAQECLEEFFPQARILRMDTDNTVGRFSYERQFGAFGAGEYDILLGTQMIAKGLDFPNVTLVGILQADSALYAQDYGSSARAFNLFTQVIGRAGRRDKPGLALIQTYTPDNPILEQAAAQDYQGFFDMDIQMRKMHLYPPFCHFVGLMITSGDWQTAQETAKLLLSKVTETAKTAYPNMPLRVMGPTPPPMSKLAGKYRQRILLKCRMDDEMRQFLREILLWADKTAQQSGAFLSVEPL